MDRETGRLTLHVVYDGAPRSGKTTSVRALARRYGREVETPEERDGRTIYFDWLDHAAGRYNDEPIQCRILAVPGQDEFAHRRAAILGAADAVIFLADTTADRYEATLLHFKNLCQRLDERTRKIPLLVQLNKRDAEGALPLSLIRPSFAPHCSFCHETVAKGGAGVHEIFVLAVGEALRAFQQAPPAEAADGERSIHSDPDLQDPVSLLERMVFSSPQN